MVAWLGCCSNLSQRRFFMRKTVVYFNNCNLGANSGTLWHTLISLIADSVMSDLSDCSESTTCAYRLLCECKWPQRPRVHPHCNPNILAQVCGQHGHKNSLVKEHVPTAALLFLLLFPRSLAFPMAVEYSISIILGRHQNSEYCTLTSIILEKYSKNTSEVLSGN